MKEKESDSEFEKLLEEFIREIDLKPPKTKTITIHVTMEESALNALKRELRKYSLTLDEFVETILEEAADNLKLVRKFIVRRYEMRSAKNAYLLSSIFSTGCRLYHILGEHLNHIGISEGLVINDVALTGSNEITLKFFPFQEYYGNFTEIMIKLEDFRVALQGKILVGLEIYYIGEEDFTMFKDEVEIMLIKEISSVLDDLDYFDVSPIEREDAIGVDFYVCDMEYEYLPHLRKIKKAVNKVCKKIKLNEKFRKMKIP